MSIDNKEPSHRIDATQAAQVQEWLTVPFEELRRQLGLNLIEAARSQFGSETNAALMRYRR